MVEIMPAILPKNLAELERGLQLMAGKVPLIHLDVLEEDIWEELHADFEVHLMVNDSSSIARLWVERGARRLIVHTLSEEILELGHEVEIGLAVEMKVPLEEIYPQVSKVNFIQLMAISEIGGQGRPFEMKIFDRIKELKQNFPEVIISVDGGVSLDNADDLVHAGVDRLVIGSAIFGADDPHIALEQFLKIK